VSCLVRLSARLAYDYTYATATSSIRCDPISCKARTAPPYWDCPGTSRPCSGFVRPTAPGLDRHHHLSLGTLERNFNHNTESSRCRRLTARPAGGAVVAATATVMPSATTILPVRLPQGLQAGACSSTAATGCSGAGSPTSRPRPVMRRSHRCLELGSGTTWS
jgi:hypothetical protein